MGCWCGSEARIDCTKVYGRKKCDPAGSKFDICVPAGSQCSTTGDKDSCQGSSIVYCDDGYVTKSDCKALGFKGCGPLVVGTTTLGAICS